MKILITKYLGEGTNLRDHEATIIGIDYVKKMQIDFISGCAINIPEDYSVEEFENVMRGMVGTIMDLPEDVYFSDGTYLPNHKDMVNDKLKGEV